MRRCLGILAAASLVFLSEGCGEPRIAGSSSETENMLARTIRVDSLLPGWNLPTAAGTVATIKLDSTNFDFSQSTSNGRDVSVERQDGRLLPFEIVHWDSAAAKGRLQVRLDSALLAGLKFIVLRWGLERKARENPAMLWKGIPDSQKLSLISFLVDDFERDTPQSLLPGTRKWYCVKDSGSAVYPPRVLASKGRDGYALHIAYSLPSFNLIGISLGVEYDFRPLDSMVFWARGTGTLSPALEFFDPDVGGKAWTHIPLDSTQWRRICLKPGDFDSADHVLGNIGWEAVRARVTNISFIVEGGRDLYIDHVRLYGLDRDDLQERP